MEHNIEFEVYLPYPRWGEYFSSFYSWNGLYYVEGISFTSINVDDKDLLQSFYLKVAYLSYGRYTSTYINLHPRINLKCMEKYLECINNGKFFCFQLNRDGYINNSLMYRYYSEINELKINCCQCSSGCNHYRIKVTPSLKAALEKYISLRKLGPKVMELHCDYYVA